MNSTNKFLNLITFGEPSPAISEPPIALRSESDLAWSLSSNFVAVFETQVSVVCFPSFMYS